MLNSLYMMTDLEYRTKLTELFGRLEKALENVDPDQVECEQTLGTLTLTFSGNSRCILSAQPSTQQLWLALAARGTAYHFNYDPHSQQWIDDKGQGVEVMQLVEHYLDEFGGIKIQLSSRREPCP